MMQQLAIVSLDGVRCPECRLTPAELDELGARYVDKTDLTNREVQERRERLIAGAPPCGLERRRP